MSNSGPYNASQAGVPQQARVASPLGTPQQQSPQIDSRKQKRHYPRFQNTELSPAPANSGYQQAQTPHQPYQQSPYQQPQQPQAPYQQPQVPYQQQQQFQPPGSPFQQPHQFRASPQPTSNYNSSVPAQPAFNGDYNQTLNGMVNMSINNSQPARQDVSLFGQAPLIEDFQRQAPSPNIPLKIAATSSPNAQVNPCFKHATVNSFPYSSGLLKKSKLPLALILQPYLSDEKVEVPVVSDTIVARCGRCKTYINPFVEFSAGALKWKCNMCTMDNDVPQEFDWDITSGQQVDRYSRAELNYGCVDFIAPAEYAIRPPQPPVYVFVIDTSFQSIQTGMVGIVAEAIKESLDKIPNEDGRTKVAFISADNAVGFYKLTGSEPEILVVGDLSDMYLPRASSDLIVNLVEYKSAVVDLLDRMKTMYQNTHAPTNCLGSALQAARKLLSPTGGKIVCYQASLPTIGDGIIKPKAEGGKSTLDSPLMSASSTWYKTFAGECTKSQVCADMFIFGNEFSDVATLNVIPRFTGGQTHFYPGFNAHNQSDAQKLKQEIISLLSEEIGLEAVMRTRCSQGIVCRSFYGNCTTRVPDIMALPNVPRDQSYCIELGIEEEITTPFAQFQTALLYTTCFGERRIRVMNLCLPVTKSISELYSSVDQIAVVRAICHGAIDKGVNGKLRDGREHLSKGVTDIFVAYGSEVMGVSSSNAQLTVCRELDLLALLGLSILKSEAFNDASTIPADIRSQSAILLRTLPIDSWKKFVHPNFYSIHNMPQAAGTLDSNGKCIMPPATSLTAEKLEAHGCYLLEDGQNIYIWIGKHAVPQLCKDLLSVNSVQEIKSGPVPMLPTLKSPISERVSRMVQELQNNRQVAYYPSIYIINEEGNPMLRSRFISRLIEDRQPSGPATAGANQESASSGMSYFQWLGFIRSKCQSK
ncbi:hypothetical protein HPULCUR_007291 [Helicostylum pulchrum]|uniref:Uncharacterized protein n=1 Tax=Helicostylum pulchrum TaxID=562976 RepID=A0ABP9Y4E7_9FUNG